MRRTEKLINILSEKTLVGDGAMGTMIYERGVFLNRCFEELNISNSELIVDIHREYVAAGVDFVETNTFGANEIKLSKFGISEKADQINSQGVLLARQAAGDEVLVAGSVGPSGVDSAGWVEEAEIKIKAAFRRHIRALNEGGVDLILLETFSDARELELAVKVAGEFQDLPVIAQLCVDAQGVTKFGNLASEVLVELCQYDNVAAVGLNCGIGPSNMLDALDPILDRVPKHVSVMPNAGMPREVDGRSIYMTTPEYMAEYAKRFFEKGARVIGGCCGTTPAHIREMVKAVHSVDKAQSRAVVQTILSKTPRDKSKGVEPVPLQERSLIGRKIASGEMVFTVEILPPRGTELSGVVEKARLCAEYGVDAINIPDGPRASSRLSPMITGLAIKEQADIEVILHVCCRDRNIISIQSDMLGAQVLGLRNALLVTGDPPKLGEFPDATAVFDLDSIALTSVVSNLNRGIDIAGHQMETPLSLTVSVGANPVASDLEREIERFKRKVDAGAEYCITQPIFDPESLYRFFDAVGDYRIPVLAGIWPFTSYKNAEFMANEVPGVVVPEKILERMSRAKTIEQGRKIGVEIAREMVQEIQDFVQGFTVSAPFGNVKIALAVMNKIDADQL